MMYMMHKEGIVFLSVEVVHETLNSGVIEEYVAALLRSSNLVVFLHLHLFDNDIALHCFVSKLEVAGSILVRLLSCIHTRLLAGCANCQGSRFV